MLLLPRGWDRIVERYTHMLKQMARQPSYYEEDPVLGWSIGPNRTSADGLFHSGPQRIRTPKRLMTYDQSAPCRVALVGDSFTFGEEALFEDTWGHYLQQALGSRCQVMNFAVPGYSIGQMFLRVQRDVLSFAPNLIIVGFTDGALERTMGVYCFLMGLEWPDCPWVAPRFVLREDDLVVTNSPLPQTDEIYSATTIRNLPAIAYDRWYQTSEWEQRNWDLLYQSYVFRYLTSLYPIHNVVSPDVSDESLRQVNGALFKAILGVGEQTGVRVLLVYLPMMEDFGYKVSYRAPVSHDILKSQGSNFLDLRDCLAQLREDHRFLERGIHYSPVGERRVAECLLPHVVKRLPKESSSAHATDS